jgi:4-amino-4-deoxy-L-arabinose transferase-like glycosyltransferase
VKKSAVFVLCLFVLQGVIYSIVVPPFEASDEKWHYPMVKYIADNWALPVQAWGVETPWRQEGSQPPLYYVLAAASTSWIDTSDLPEVRRLNPHVDAGATPDGNINLVVHDQARESLPWRGTVAAIHLVRFLSVLMGAAGVYLTYLVASEVMPNRPLLSLAAMAIHAFTPMLVFISSSVNNDALVVPLSSLALLLLLRLIPRGNAGAEVPPPLRQYLLLGIVLGLAALTKTSSLALTVLTALVVIARAVRTRSWPEFWWGCTLTAVPVLLIAGWWYARNLRLYGDVTGLNVFIEILGKREVPADLAQLWRERNSFLAGYWGNFGGLNLPFPGAVYLVLNGVALAAGIGLLAKAVGALARLARCPGWPSRVRLLVDTYGPLLLCALWGLGVMVPWVYWASTTWSSQGRLVFPAIASWSVFFALGLNSLPGVALGRWAPVCAGVLLLSATAVAPWALIGPAYAIPEPITEAESAAIPFKTDVEFDGVLRLVGHDFGGAQASPGDSLEVTLFWDAMGSTSEDYSVFVHVLGEGDLLVSQRDTFPGLGLLSTMRLASGYSWADRYVLDVPETAYAPDVAQLEVGLYSVESGERLVITRPRQTAGHDSYRFGEVDITRSLSPFGNPVSINYDHRVELVGYEIAPRVISRQQTAMLELYWRGLSSMSLDYTFSVQLIDASQRKAAQNDSWPRDGKLPTSLWVPGEVVEEARALEVYPDAAAGVYDVRVAVYHNAEAGLVHLPVISEEGEMLSSHALLGRVRVLP